MSRINKRLYVLVDYNLNQIISPVNRLTPNWCNISGLDLVSTQRLADMSWAGITTNFSWREVNDIPEGVTGSTDWATTSKLNVKFLVEKGEVSETEAESVNNIIDKYTDT